MYPILPGRLAVIAIRHADREGGPHAGSPHGLA